MKPLDHWGTPEHAARMATIVQMQHNVTSPTRRVKPRGIDWGLLIMWAAFVLLGIAFWARLLVTFTSILGG